MSYSTEASASGEDGVSGGGFSGAKLFAELFAMSYFVSGFTGSFEFYQIQERLLEPF
jgi:hypothetical protein